MDDKLDRILESLQQLSVNLESVRVSVHGLIQDAADHERRLRTLERWRNNLTPIIAMITFVLGSLFNAALRLLG